MNSYQNRKFHLSASLSFYNQTFVTVETDSKLSQHRARSRKVRQQYIHQIFNQSAQTVKRFYPNSKPRVRCRKPANRSQNQQFQRLFKMKDYLERKLQERRVALSSAQPQLKKLTGPMVLIINGNSISNEKIKKELSLPKKGFYDPNRYLNFKDRMYHEQFQVERAMREKHEEIAKTLSQESVRELVRKMRNFRKSSK